jgi:hypothetical protein
MVLTTFVLSSSVEGVCCGLESSHLVFVQRNVFSSPSAGSPCFTINVTKRFGTV